MSRLMKKAIVLGTIGFWMGLAISFCMYFLLNDNDQANIVFTADDFVKLMVGGIYGSMPMGGMVIYEIEEWSIFRATATHFVITFTGLVLLAVIQGWFNLSNPVFWIISVFCLLAYILIWLFNYLSFKRHVNEMNKVIREIHSSKAGEQGHQENLF